MLWYKLNNIFLIVLYVLIVYQFASFILSKGGYSPIQNLLFIWSGFYRIVNRLFFFVAFEWFYFSIFSDPVVMIPSARKLILKKMYRLQVANLFIYNTITPLLHGRKSSIFFSWMNFSNRNLFFVQHFNEHVVKSHVLK